MQKRGNPFLYSVFSIYISGSIPVISSFFIPGSYTQYYGTVKIKENQPSYLSTIGFLLLSWIVCISFTISSYMWHMIFTFLPYSNDCRKEINLFKQNLFHIFFHNQAGKKLPLLTGSPFMYYFWYGFTDTVIVPAKFPLSFFVFSSQ